MSRGESVQKGRFHDRKACRRRGRAAGGGLGSGADAPGKTPEKAAAKRFGTWGIDVEGMDRSVKPGDDFFAYASGKWASSTQIPADKVSCNSFNILGDLSEARVRSIIERWAADEKLKPGSDEAKVAAGGQVRSAGGEAGRAI